MSLDQVVSHIASLDFQRQLSSSLVVGLSATGSIPVAKRLEIVDSQITYMEKDDIRMCFDNLDLGVFKSVLDGGNGKIPITPINESILEKLVEERYVSSFKINEDEPNVFNVYGKRVMRKGKGTAGRLPLD